MAGFNMLLNVETDISLGKDSLRKANDAYSVYLLKSSSSLDRFMENIEHDLIYKRGLNGADTGLLTIQKYRETTSPFYDLEFFEFCLSKPIYISMNHKLYKKWILTKYPEAANYVWEKTKQKIKEKQISIKYKGDKLSLSRIPSLILGKMGFKKNGINSKKHINPLNYWYFTNKEIKEFQDNYFDQNIHLITNEALRKDCVQLYMNCGAIEKNQVLSLLAAQKIFMRQNKFL